MSNLAVGTTLMMGNVYLPSMVGVITRPTPTQYVVRLDDGNECRVRKTDMRVVGGDLRTFRVVAAEDVASEREQHRRDRAMMSALFASLCRIESMCRTLIPGRLWRDTQQAEDVIRRKSKVDIKMATEQINECAATLSKLNGEEV